MERPSSVLVPRPTSSMITRERSVALLRILAVSVISTRKVDSPFARLSLAPTRQKILSTMPIRAFFAGTKHPVWASRAMRAFCLRNVLLPAMFGPVIRAKLLHDFSPYKSRLFGTNSPRGRCCSTTGCLPSSMTNSRVPSEISGLTQLCETEASAKELVTSV